MTLDDSPLISDEEYGRLSLAAFNATGHCLIDPRHASDHIRELVLGCIRQEQWWLDRKIAVQYNRQSRVLFGVTEATKATATAITTQNGDFIVVSLGLIVQGMVYFNMAMCHPEILSQWGNSSAERWPRSSGEIGYAPLDHKRKVICRLLQRMALRYVISHELVHILHGHLRIRPAINSSYCIDEALRQLPPEKAIQTQTLEIDADIGAIPECFGDTSIWLETLNDGRSRDWLPAEDSPLTHERIITLWCFAIYSTFRVMDNGRHQPPFRFSSHPRSMQRVMMFFFHLDERLQNAGNENEREVLAKAFAEAVFSGKQAFRMFGINSIAQESADDLAYGSFDNYPQAINAKWVELRLVLTSMNSCSVELPLSLLNVAKIEPDRLLRHFRIEQQI